MRLRSSSAGRILLGSLFALALDACAAFAPPATDAVPSAPPEAPSAASLREGHRLQRAGLARLAPPGGTAPDTEGAAQLIDRAARLGDPDAQMMLAMSHLSGSGSARDPAAALHWLHRAAAQGQPDAQYQLARLLEAGDGTRRDAAWAAVWFQRAAERGQPQAQYALALMQIAGAGTARDEAEALARLTIASQRGVAAARRYRDALRPRVPPAAARAAEARVRSETARGPVPAVDRPLARFAQSALAAQGLWNAPVDGLDGPATRAALATFARTHGLAASAPYAPAVIDRLRGVQQGA